MFPSMHPEDLLSGAFQQFSVPKYTLRYQEQEDVMKLKHGASEKKKLGYEIGNDKNGHVEEAKKNYCPYKPRKLSIKFLLFARSCIDCI